VKERRLEYCLRCWHGTYCGWMSKVCFCSNFQHKGRIIFNNVKGAFVAPYQSAPLDLGTPHFYNQRKAAIDQLLQELVCISSLLV
jgi:hypothetical protein